MYRRTQAGVSFWDVRPPLLPLPLPEFHYCRNAIPRRWMSSSSDPGQWHPEMAQGENAVQPPYVARHVEQVPGSRALGGP